MSKIQVNQISPTSPDGVVNFTGNNPPTYNGVPLGTGGGGGSGGGGGGPSSGYVDPRPIRTTPPAPVNLRAQGAFRSVILDWQLENYINHAYVQIVRSTTDNVATATAIGTSTTNLFTDPNVAISTTYFYWVRAFNIEGASGPYNAVGGVSAGILRIGNTDLGPLSVEAAQLANGSVTATKLAANTLTLTNFASGIEPIGVVSTLPNPVGYTGPRLVLLATDNKVYRYTGTGWTASVPTADLTGSIVNSQIAGLDASKLTGTLNGALLSEGTITATKFAVGIEPIALVSAIPLTRVTAFIFNTADGNTYRWNGTAYTKSLLATDITGTLTDAQLQSLNAAKLTGTIDVGRIAQGSLDLTKFAANIEPIAQVTAIPTTKITTSIFNLTDGKLYRWTGTAYVTGISATEITGTISTGQIADGSISSTKFASSIEPYTLVSAVPTTKLTNIIFNTSDGRMYRWTGTAYEYRINGGDIIGSVSTTEIADGSISLTKFASGLEPIVLVSTLPTVKVTSTVFNTTDGKLYRWNGTAYVKLITGGDIGVGEITSTQIADQSITTPKLVAGQINANVLAAGTISTNLMSANTINGDRILVNSLDAGRIVAASITATQIASAGITADKLAANAVTANTIAANAVTADKIAANSITADKIAANSIGAGQIAAGAISAAQIAAGGITADRLAAGTITGDKISANTITSTNLAAASVTADKIAAGTITAGQIAAGAIGANQIAANAVRASNLLITGQGMALNDDPNFEDISAWFSFPGQAFPEQIDITDGPSGTKAFRFTNSSAITSKIFPAEAGTQFKVTIQLKRLSGESGAFIRLQCLNADNAETGFVVTDISGGFNFEGVLPPLNSFNKFVGTITAPPGTVKARLLLFTNTNSTGVTIGQNFRVEAYVGADLIVDGAITSRKIQANSVEGNRIIANSLSADRIVAGSITTDRFTPSSISGVILSDGSISGNKIVANSITAGQIAAGAINAQQIAAGAITATKLTLANRDSILPDPTWDDRSFWTGNRANDPSLSHVYKVELQSWPIRHGIVFTASQGAFQFQSLNIPIELGASYRARVFIYIGSDFSGDISIDQLYPYLTYMNLNIPRNGVTQAGRARIDVENIPRNTFHEYITTFTNANYIVNPIDPNTHTSFVCSGNITSGQFYFWIEIVRAANSDLIVDGAITTQKILANSINGDRIAANTLTADKIQSNSITAGQIQAGAIGADQLAVNAIRAQHILVMPKSLNLDASFEKGNLWSGFVQRVPKAQAAGGNCPALFTTQFRNQFCLLHTDNSFSQPFTTEVVPGEQYRISAWAWNGSGGGFVGVFAIARLADGSTTGVGLTGTNTSTAQNTWVRLSAVYTVASNVTGLFPGVVNESDNVTQRWFADLSMEKVNDASLIVDGAITATKIAANAIAVGSAAIENGAIRRALIETAAIDEARIADLAVTNAKIGNAQITDAKIANATITSAKIASVDAGTITVGTLSGDRIGANSITASKLNVNSLSAVSSEMGNVVISSNGSIRSGQSGFNSGVGWWQGIDGGVAKVSYGSPNGAYFLWDGNNIVINGGSLVNPTFNEFSATIPGGNMDVAVPQGLQFYGNRSVSVQGGKAPFRYRWVLENVFSDSPLGTIQFSGDTNLSSCSVQGNAFGTNGYSAWVRADLTCLVTDDNGRTAPASIRIYAIHGTGPLP